MKDDSNRGRVELKGSTRHAHLDVNGMDIDVGPEDIATNGELHEVIVDGAPKPMDPIMAVMGILLRVEVALKEADTCMQDGDETSWWQLMDARPSVATLQQARQVILTRLKRCGSGHRLSTICRKCTAPGYWHCHVGREEIQCWMCHDRLSHTASTVLEERIVEDALSCSLHKIGSSLVEKVVGGE